MFSRSDVLVRSFPSKLPHHLYWHYDKKKRPISGKHKARWNTAALFLTSVGVLTDGPDCCVIMAAFILPPLGGSCQNSVTPAASHNSSSSSLLPSLLFSLALLCVRFRNPLQFFFCIQFGNPVLVSLFPWQLLNAKGGRITNAFVLRVKHRPRLALMLQLCRHVHCLLLTSLPREHCG